MLVDQIRFLPFRKERRLVVHPLGRVWHLSPGLESVIITLDRRCQACPFFISYLSDQMTALIIASAEASIENIRFRRLRHHSVDRGQALMVIVEGPGLLTAAARWRLRGIEAGETIGSSLKIVPASFLRCSTHVVAIVFRHGIMAVCSTIFSQSSLVFSQVICLVYSCHSHGRISFILDESFLKSILFVNIKCLCAD